MMQNFTQYVNDSFYQNVTSSGYFPDPIAIIGWNGDQLLFYLLTLMVVLQTIQAVCLLYLVVRSRRSKNPGRDE